MKVWHSLCLVLVLTTPLTARAQELKRRGSLGVALRPLTAAESSGGSVHGAAVDQVAPDGSAQRAGVQAGDIIFRAAGAEIATPEELVAAVRRLRAGDTFDVMLLRSSQTVQRSIVLLPVPYESDPSLDVLYRAISVGGSLRRTIITKPKQAGRLPAILFVGGLGCYSLDGLSADKGPYGQLIYGLSRDGYVVMRVEKSGEGDSQGPPCSSPEADFKQEVAAYVAGLKSLKDSPFVDPNRVFIFAHSIGPLVGVVAANEVPVSGFVAAETIGRNWFDYELDISRQQMLDLGKPYDEVERSQRVVEQCLHRFYVEKLAPPELLKSDPRCSGILVPGVPHTYLQQVGDLNLADYWKKLDIPVLVTYGTNDPATTAADSRYLADMINSFHPGRATYREIDGMSHVLNVAASKRDFLLNGPGPNAKLSPAFLQIVEDWLKERQSAEARPSDRP